MPVGLDCKLYRDTAAYASPTWSNVLSVMNLSIPGSTNAVDKSSRASVYKQYAPGQIDIGLTFGMVRSDDATNYAAFRTAWFNRTTMDIAVADAAIATTLTSYLRAQLIITKFEEKQDLEGELQADIELKPTDVVAHPPIIVTV